MGFLVWFELLRSVEMDCQARNFHKRPSSAPVLALQFFSIFALDDNFSGQSQISIKPSSPQATTISHHVKLQVSQSIFLAMRSNLQAGRISVAAHDLECRDWLLSAQGSCKERADCRAITREVVSFACFKVPFSSLLELSEAILGKLILAIIDGVEVTW